jgi:hypothetical protein
VVIGCQGVLNEAWTSKYLKYRSKMFCFSHLIPNIDLKNKLFREFYNAQKNN